MRRLSRRVTGVTKPMTRRTAWIANLKRNETLPEGWVECANTVGTGTSSIRIPIGCHGAWDRHAPAWSRTIEFAERLYRGQEEPARCTSEIPTGGVIAWGGTFDRWLAEQRGLVEVDCGATANEFYAKRAP
jgi:hypothetical protein